VPFVTSEPQLDTMVMRGWCRSALTAPASSAIGPAA